MTVQVIRVARVDPPLPASRGGLIIGYCDCQIGPVKIAGTMALLRKGRVHVVMPANLRARDRDRASISIADSKARFDLAAAVCEALNKFSNQTYLPKEIG